MHGKLLQFVRVHTQNKTPSLLKLSMADRKALDNAVHMFLERKILEECASGVHGFISNVFPSFKQDGSA